MHPICWLRKETVRIASDHLLAINLYTLSIFVYHWYKSNIKRVDIYERHGVSSAEIWIRITKLRRTPLSAKPVLFYAAIE